MCRIQMLRSAMRYNNIPYLPSSLLTSAYKLVPKCNLGKKQTLNEGCMYLTNPESMTRACLDHVHGHDYCQQV